MKWALENFVELISMKCNTLTNSKRETISHNCAHYSRIYKSMGMETNKSDTSAGLAGHVREKYFIFVRKLTDPSIFRCVIVNNFRGANWCAHRNCIPPTREQIARNKCSFIIMYRCAIVYTLHLISSILFLTFVY